MHKKLCDEIVCFCLMHMQCSLLCPFWVACFIKGQVKQTCHSGLACVNFVFQIHTTQKVFWPLKIIIQIVFKWFWMIVPNFNYFEAIFVFLTNCCCHLPYESEDLKPPKACPRLLRAVKWSKRKSCILIKFIILDHKKAGLGRPS